LTEAEYETCGDATLSGKAKTSQLLVHNPSVFLLKNYQVNENANSEYQ
jgi:hypothetical protein